MELLKSESGKRLSLDAFKSKASLVNAEQSMEKIGGGIFDDCHAARPSLYDRVSLGSLVTNVNIFRPIGS